MWDDNARKKSLIGHPGNRPVRWNGGHGHGRNVPGKTEFPERWTDGDIDLILAETWENPTVVTYVGDRRTARRVTDGVLVEVSAFESSNQLVGFEFRGYHPVSGRDISSNHRNGKRSRKQIPRITTEWEVVRNEP